MKFILQYASIALLLTNCSTNYEKDNIEYGNIVFTADYDALMSNDRMNLYDNGIFLIYISNYKANGYYQVIGDTLILDYFIENDFFAKGYLLKGYSGWIKPMKKIEGFWQIDDKMDSGLMTSMNELKE